MTLTPPPMSTHPAAAAGRAAGVDRAAGADRAAVLFSVLSVVALAAVCSPFLLGAGYPEWLTLVGRWIPLLLSLLVMRLVPVGRTVTDLWGLRAPGRRTLVVSLVAGVAAVLAAAAVPALLADATGLAELKPWSTLGPVLMALPLYVALGSLSTFGEEVAWRGYLHRLLERRGFWFTAVVVSAVWTVFHVAQLGIFVVAGEMGVRDLAAGLLGIFALGLLLAALVDRFGTVWPAVVGHAVPVSSTLLLTSVPASDLAFWGYAVLSAAVTALAAVLVRRR